jgi:pyruvate dehydrogenase E1 component beta subunit
MNFTQAITESTLKTLKKNKKKLLIGLEVSNESAGFYKLFPKQVLETPVSELSSTGMAVGLASKGYIPTVVYGRIEFALLALDQILTQAARWEYMFGEKYKCPAKFRIQIGRQWGNGPQHTANYHSIFLQSNGLDIFIPATPKEAYEHICYMDINNKPSVFFEHRYLSLVKQDFKIKNKFKKPNNSKIYKINNQRDILLITYADTLITALETQKYLMKFKIFVTILNLSYLPSNERVSKKDVGFIKKFKNIIFLDSAPFEFGILSGIHSMISIQLKNNNFSYLSPPNTPAPSSPIHMHKYYINKNDVIKKIMKIKKKKIKIKKISFEESILWPNYSFK